jgi:membrane-associated protease RseP (regulator of RpoE activity)
MLFPDKADVVVGELSAKCIDVKWTVVSSGSNQVVCESPLNFGQSLLGQMLMGNSYSTPPHRYFRFNVAQINGISRVQASGWVELQMAFGQTKRTDFSGASFHNGMMEFMAAAGGKYPPGTTFPNHAALGVKSEGVQDGKFWNFRVTEVEPDSVAAKAGIQVGDVVDEIAGKRFKNTDDYLDATAKAAAGSTYAVEFTRNGKAMTATVDTAFRPAITEQVIAKAEPSPTLAAPAQSPSVADEIAKLAALKDKGVLTEAEFEAQKKKLLGEQ